MGKLFYTDIKGVNGEILKMASMTIYIEIFRLYNIPLFQKKNVEQNQSIKSKHFLRERFESSMKLVFWSVC